MKGHRNLAGTLIVWSIRGYQTFISPALRPSCKYYPSCSQYAIDAVREFGVMRGVVLAGWRLLRCNPLSYGGYDPVERQRVFASGANADRSRCRAVHACADQAGASAALTRTRMSGV